MQVGDILRLSSPGPADELASKVRGLALIAIDCH
jgi:hypothetical protein